MVSVAAGEVGRGVRVRLRLALLVLVALFLATVVTLLVTLQRFVIVSQASTKRQRVHIAGTISRELANLSRADVFTVAEDLRSRYSLLAVEVRDPGALPVRVGVPKTSREIDIAQTVGARTTTSGFPATVLDQIERRITAFVAAAIGVALLTGLLFSVYIVSLSSPLEAVLRGDDGPRKEHDPTQYLIDTFKSSLTTLKSDARELQRLRDLEKSRADELERVTATLVRSLTSGFIAIDAAGTIVDLNNAAREILAIPDERPAGQRTIEEVLGDSRFAAELQKAIAGRLALQRQEVARDESGADVIGLTTVPLFGEENDYLGMLALFTDLTPVRRLEQRVRDMQSLADLGEISAGIAHEFRNSLSTILGYLRLASKSEAMEQSRGHMKQAAAEAEQLTDAVERLLTFARPLQPRTAKVSVTEILESIVARLEPVSAGVAFTMSLEPLEIEGDAALLSRAMENVLRNAVDAVRQKGTDGNVWVSVDAAAKRIVIRDDGAGLDAHMTSRLFLPFQSTKPQGFGLGLALTKKILVIHGGSIRLTGEPGQGATATIEL